MEAAAESDVRGRHVAGGRPTPETTTLYRVKQLELTIRAQLDQMLRPFEITVTQYTAMTVLRSSGALSASQLARLAFVRPQSMSDIVDALVARGLVSRTDDPVNRRQRLLRLTRRGSTLLTRLDVPAGDIEERMLVGLSQAARAQLRSSLESCRRSLHD